MTNTYQAIKILLNNLDRKELVDIFKDIQKKIEDENVDLDIIELIYSENPTSRTLGYLYLDDPITAKRFDDIRDYSFLSDIIEAYVNYDIPSFIRIIGNYNTWTDKQLYILNILKNRIDIIYFKKFGRFVKQE